MEGELKDQKKRKLQTQLKRDPRTGVLDRQTLAEKKYDLEQEKQALKAKLGGIAAKMLTTASRKVSSDIPCRWSWQLQERARSS